jgi:hypothetical protein
MRLGQQKATRASTLHFFVALVVLVLLAGAVLAGNQRGWQRVLTQRIATLVPSVGTAAPAAELPTLAIDMRYADYSTLLAQREEALQTGVYISNGQDFAPAVLRVDGEQAPVELRLMEGPAQRLGEDDKWSLEVRTRDDHQVLGMRQFYLLDPEANHWLNQWAFAQALQREDILSAPYRFARLIVNGDDRGIVAVQEEPSVNLLEAQGRSPGVIVEFDADLLWASIAHFQGDAQAAYADPVSHLRASDLRYFQVDNPRDAAVGLPPEDYEHRKRATALLRSLQTGQEPAADVLDVERYGRYLALVDLWGALDGLSLVNLRLHYDPAADRLEPIGFNAKALGSEARLPLEATYGDPRIQATYVREATRLAQPEYLEQLRTELGPDWQRLARAVSSEAGNADPPWETLSQRQEYLSRSLDPVQPVFAHQVMPSSAPTPARYDTLSIDVANVLTLPVEVVGFEIDRATLLDADPQWLEGMPARDLVVREADGVVLRALDPARVSAVRYARFEIPLSAIHALDREIDLSQDPEIEVVTRVLGRSDVHRTPVRRDVPSLPTGAAQ